MKYDIIELKPYNIVRYLKCIYIVKDFFKNEDGKYILSYYFRTINESNAKLYSNGSYAFYGFHAEKIRRASRDETKHFISRIKKEKPDFDLQPVENAFLNEENLSFNEKECLNILKSKGYLIYRQV